MSRAAARQAVQSQYFFVANQEEAFSVFGRSEVQEVNRIRYVTDVPFLIAFMLVGAGMLLLDADALHKGNVLRLSEPIDFQGYLCGYDEAVADKPLGYFPNPYNDMIICVSACPKVHTDGNFTLPDGPMGKYHMRRAYPTAKTFGQFCLPLDLHLARRLISAKSIQSEAYKALGHVFSSPDVLLLILLAPFVTSIIYIVMLLYQPALVSAVAISTTAALLALVATIADLDIGVLEHVPLYMETHPMMLKLHPYFVNACYGASIVFVFLLFWSIRIMTRAQPVFKECMSAIINQNVMVTIFASMAISGLRIMFILHVCKHAALLMSITNPVDVLVRLFGEWHYVPRHAWSPFELHGLFFYAFGTFWILEFMSFCNKYITAQILCQNYFSLKAYNVDNHELNHGKSNPLWYALYSLFRYHLGSVAYAALLAFPCRTLKFLIGLFVPDRPNLDKSPNAQDNLAYWLFLPLIQIDLFALRFFKDSVFVMLALKGYAYMQAAHRTEGLLNRSRGKIPNLTKFTGRIDAILNISVGLTAMFWTFFLFREPRHGRYHEVERINSRDSIEGLFEVPEHSPLLALPAMLMFGLWVGNGMLHLVAMASNALTVSYCIDVEMVGGTETDALFVPKTLKVVYKDLGGGESERQLSEMIAQAQGM